MKNTAALPHVKTDKPVETVMRTKKWRQRRRQRSAFRRWSTPCRCLRSSCRCQIHSCSCSRIHGCDSDHRRRRHHIHIHMRSLHDQDHHHRFCCCCCIWESIPTWKTRSRICMRTKMHPFLPTRCGININIDIMCLWNPGNNMTQNSNNSNNRSSNMRIDTWIILIRIIDKVRFWRRQGDDITQRVRLCIWLWVWPSSGHQNQQQWCC